MLLSVKHTRGGGQMANRKIVHVITNRASYGRVRNILKEINNTDGLELIIVKAGAAVDLEIDFETDYLLHCLVNDDSHVAMVKTASLMANECSTLFSIIKPDVVLIHGDRYEQLGVAMAASYLNIKIAHTEGGEVSGCIDDKVRNAITALADIHLPVTEKAFMKLHFMNGRNIFKVGSPAIDLCREAVESDLNDYDDEPYILVLHHPNTTDKEKIEPMIRVLDRMPVKKIWINSNIDAGSKEMARLFHKTDWEFRKNLSPKEYYVLLNNCEVAVGNSSSFIKEGAYLGVPVVLVGSRQQSREMQENVMLASDESEQEIENAISLQIQHERYSASHAYGDGTSSQKIVTILQEVSL